MSTLETHKELRPKFAYSGGWGQEDLEEVEEEFKKIEAIALKVLGNA